jgi:hypothetical protein
MENSLRLSTSYRSIFGKRMKDMNEGYRCVHQPRAKRVDFSDLDSNALKRGSIT